MAFNHALRQRSNIILTSFLAVTFLVGVANAFQTPTLSRFLTDEVKVSPILVGLFYSVNAIAAIVVSFMLALYSDKQGDRRRLILICSIMGIGNCVTFAFTRHYLLLITMGVFFSSVASAATPQLFALAREYAVKTGRNLVSFNAILRAQISLAWVIGPPLSFIIAVQQGFTVMYLCAGVMFLLAICVALLFLPKMSRQAISKNAPSLPQPAIFADKSVVILFAATIFMWTANMMYLIDMPLYVDKVLQLSTSLPGHMMGMAAAIEIPVMLIAGLLSPHFGKKRLFYFAIGCGIVFYIGMLSFTHASVLLALQILNALFIGIVASLGILYFQDLLPTRVGVASTLFTNGVACSVIIAGLIQGIVSDYIDHYAIYAIALAMLVISLILCRFIRSV